MREYFQTALKSKYLQKFGKNGWQEIKNGVGDSQFSMKGWTLISFIRPVNNFFLESFSISCAKIVEKSKDTKE